MAQFMLTNKRSKSQFENNRSLLTETGTIDYQTTPYALFQSRRKFTNSITFRSNQNRNNTVNTSIIGGLLSKYITNKQNTSLQVQQKISSPVAIFKQQKRSKQKTNIKSNQLQKVTNYQLKTTQPSVTFKNRLLTIDTSDLIQAKLQENQQIFQIKKQKPQDFREQTKVTLTQKLKINLLIVIAVIRISKNYRIRIQRAQYQQILNSRKLYLSFIRKLKIQELKILNQKYVQIIITRLLSQFQETYYIKECSQLWGNDGTLQKDLKRTRFCVLSLMLMEGLVNFTNRKNMPDTLLHQMNNCLFEEKGRFCSKFVFNRTYLLSEQVTNLPEINKVLIAAEFYFFEIIIPNFLQIVSELIIKNISHHNQTLYYCVTLISLLQSLFINHFRKMGKIKLSNITQMQRFFKMAKEIKSGLMTVSIECTDKMADDENLILYGFFKSDPMANIFKDKPKWSNQMKEIFEQILKNLVRIKTIKQPIIISKDDLFFYFLLQLI